MVYALRVCGCENQRGVCLVMVEECGGGGAHAGLNHSDLLEKIRILSLCRLAQARRVQGRETLLSYRSAVPQVH